MPAIKASYRGVLMFTKRVWRERSILAWLFAVVVVLPLAPLFGLGVEQFSGETDLDAKEVCRELDKITN